MKKLLSALLIATMLIASVTCALAVSAEEAGTTTETDSNVLVNFMPAAGEGEGYTITANADGSVTIKLTAAATTAVNIKLPMPEGTTFDNDTNAIVVMEYKEGEGAKIDKMNSGSSDGTPPAGTWVNYSRKKTGKDEANDGYVYLGTMLIKNGQKDKDGNPDANDAYRTNNTLDNNNTTPEIAYGTFDVGKYAAPNKPDSGKHKVVSAQIGLTGTEGAELTIYSFALVKSIEGLTLGEGKPIVKPATTDPDPDEGDGKDDDKTSDGDSTGSSATTTPAESSSTAPGTGDTGMIVFAVLAVLAVVGGVAVVRVRR